MANNLIEGIELEDINFRAENTKLQLLVAKMAKGVEPCANSKASNKYWHDWKAGSHRAIDQYIRSNVKLFYCVAVKIQAKFFHFSLEEVFSMVVGYAQIAFTTFDPDNGTTLVSYHMRYAQYHVSKMFVKQTKQYSTRRQLYKKALAMSDSTGKNVKDCIIDLVRERRTVKRDHHKEVIRAAETILHACRPKASLNKRIGHERDSLEVVDTLSSGPVEVEESIDRAHTQHRLNYIKSELSKDFNDTELKIFKMLLRGLPYLRLATELGVDEKSAKYQRMNVMNKLRSRAKKLKAKGVELPAIF